MTMRHRAFHRFKTNHTGHFPGIKPFRCHRHPVPRRNTGFALVVTLSLMILLTIIAVGLLSLSAVSLRSSSQGNAQAEAKANARLALMIAIGELQKEMGPDMRVSASASILDTNEETEEIDNVAEPHWLASYDSWGDWLNANYEVPGKSSMGIAGTYVPGRKPMFRKWLVSLPDVQAGQMDTAKTSLSGNNVTLLVGEGSAADSKDQVHASMVNLVKNNQTAGRYAWWMGAENQKARIDKAKRPRSLSADEWETSQGDTAEVGVGALDGFDALDHGRDSRRQAHHHSNPESLPKSPRPG